MTTHDKMSDEVPTAMESPTEPMDPPMTKTEHGPTDDAMQRPVEDSLSTSAASRKAARKHRSVARPRDLMGEGHQMPAGSEVMGKGHPMPAGSDLMGDRLYESQAESNPKRRPRDLMGEGHEMPAGSGVMGKGHPMPAGSDLMGDRLYETEFETQSETETGGESDPK